METIHPRAVKPLLRSAKRHWTIKSHQPWISCAQVPFAETLTCHVFCFCLACKFWQTYVTQQPLDWACPCHTFTTEGHQKGGPFELDHIPHTISDRADLHMSTVQAIDTQLCPNFVASAPIVASFDNLNVAFHPLSQPLGPLLQLSTRAVWRIPWSKQEQLVVSTLSKYFINWTVWLGCCNLLYPKSRCTVIYQIILALWIPFAAAIFNILNFRSKGHFSGFKGQFTGTSENPIFYPYFMVKTMVSGEDFPLKTNPIFAFVEKHWQKKQNHRFPHGFL